MTTFTDLKLSAPLMQALATEGYETPTPIQAQAIPPLLEGRDLLGIAQTGTGKTAAFALPLLQRLTTTDRRAAPRCVRALILTPTRELCVQILDSFRSYGRHLRISRAAVYGGVSQGPQVHTLSRGVDVLVATPGRLLDLMNQGQVRFDGLEAFVLDEADRMLDMGFILPVKRIVAKLPRQRQTLLFSATMPQDVEGLAANLLTQPVRVEVAPVATTAERISQRVHFVEKANKRALLHHVLSNKAVARALVFTRTKHGANKVGDQLERLGVRADVIHGNKSQNARQKALEDFRNGKVRVLVATDIAARGIDVDGITHVINFDLPNEPESYVHRIGRTARAGNEGIAISFCDSDERAFLRDIEKTIRQQVAVDADHPFHAAHIAEGGRGQNARGATRTGGGARQNGDRNNGISRDRLADERREKGRAHGSGSRDGARSRHRTGEDHAHGATAKRHDHPHEKRHVDTRGERDRGHAKDTHQPREPRHGGGGQHHEASNKGQRPQTSAGRDSRHAGGGNQVLKRSRQRRGDSNSAAPRSQRFEPVRMG
ncbi:MAG TPA: DEAD/DEAH box helicase [Dongiaceae bacterium]